ncbi:MAG: hypothetical protein IJE81_05640 [Oscillospiraceae bacterium]|nr:hypothetical protein [Oscillospiraceae bacterium]
MKKTSMADKLAQKSFNSPEIKKSWAVHMQAFGPILKPAFAEDYQARVHLCAALNHISNKNLPQALLKLNGLQKRLVTEADKAAFLFCMGLFCETAGKKEEMVALYTQCNEFGHKFYLPYLKVGKFHLDTCSYDEAEASYRSAIGCFTATGLSDQEKLILSSAYTNLASCLVMMHRYGEAEAALTTSRSLCPDAPGRAAPEAALHAVRGEKEQVEACLSILSAHAPAAYEAIKKSTDKILAGTDPLFFAVPVEEEKIAAFWAWFADASDDLHKKLDAQEYESAISAIAGHLLEAFPFLEEPPYVALGKNEKGYVIQLKDMYAIGISKAYTWLLDACTEEILARWQFDVVH